MDFKHVVTLEDGDDYVFFDNKLIVARKDNGVEIIQARNELGGDGGE